MIPSERLAAAARAVADAQSELLQARQEADAAVMAMDPEERIRQAKSAFDVAYAGHPAAEAALRAAKESGEGLDAAYAAFGALAHAERELALAQNHLPPEPVSNPATPGLVTQLNALVVGQR
jgi:hypothetical protein